MKDNRPNSLEGLFLKQYYEMEDKLEETKENTENSNTEQVDADIE